MKSDSILTRSIFVIVTIAVMSAYGFVALRSVFSPPTVSIPLKPLIEPEKHVATEVMIRQATDKTAELAPTFSATDGQGMNHDSSTSLMQHPTVLIFIKNGCPCSVSAQPFFEKISKAYGDRVAFLGVIDGTPDTAKAWGEKYRAKIPILADPALKIVRAYGAESSVYVVLIGPDGKIVRAWPGHSQEMLEELVGLLESSTGFQPKKLDFDDAPENLMAGCPFDTE
jgi:peroxiredoxin